MKQCPKCHKTFTQDLTFCSVCGYRGNNFVNDNKSIKENIDFKTCPQCGKQYLYLIDHCSGCGYSTQAYKNKIMKLQDDIEKPLKQRNTPKCPTCSSTNIYKISATHKVAGAIGFGLLSKTARSQFECKNCGYKW